MTETVIEEILYLAVKSFQNMLTSYVTPSLRCMASIYPMVLMVITMRKNTGICSTARNLSERNTGDGYTEEDVGRLMSLEEANEDDET